MVKLPLKNKNAIKTFRIIQLLSKTNYSPTKFYNYGNAKKVFITGTYLSGIGNCGCV